MILGTYRNPKYRSVRPSPSLSPPAPAPVIESPGSSPKRKREDEEVPISSLRIGTASSDTERPLTGPNSPRTKVAARLGDLEITAPPIASDESSSPRKRHKRNPGVRREDFETPVRERERRVEIPESERVESDVPGDEWDSSPSSPSTSPTDLQALRKSFEMTDTGQTSSPKKKRLSSPPPPSPPAPLILPSSEKSSLPPQGTLTSSPVFAPTLTSSSTKSSLTWHDFEITGHLLLSPDDDGEGINGVGFRPTPAMAWARSQKRKLQVEGWKNREAREARQRRVEKRRGERNDGNGGRAEGRVVRFAEEG